MKSVFLDSNAGAPLHPKVVEVLCSHIRRSGDIYSEKFTANPSSIHLPGRKAMGEINLARDRVAKSLDTKTPPERIIFSSSGTEANQFIIRSILDRTPGSHWITTPVEHDSVLKMIGLYRDKGHSVSLLPVDSDGAPIIEALEDLWQPNTALVSSIHVNNETGVISPVLGLAEAVQRRRQEPDQKTEIFLHLDAAQAWGKIPLNVESIACDFISFSGHKIGALPGVGGVYFAKGRGKYLSPIIPGNQERGRRGGTENLPGLISIGVAASHLDPSVYSSTLTPLRDRLQSAISHRIPDTIVNGEDAPRVAGTLNISFNGIEGDSLVMAMDLAGYALSAGSACSSGVIEPSHVLLAMGRTKNQALSALRISMHQEVPWEVLEGFVGALEAAVDRIRRVGADWLAENSVGKKV